MNRTATRKLLTILKWCLEFTIDKGSNEAIKAGFSIDDLRNVYAWILACICKLNNKAVVHPEQYKWDFFRPFTGR